MKDVIVIGAGMAGLTAARALNTAGYTVSVIEGRDRIGGRIQTIRDFCDQPIEAGAEFIHGALATIRPEAETAGLKLVPCPLMRHTLFNIGGATRWLPLIVANPQVWPTYTILHKLGQHRATDLTVREFVSGQNYRGPAKVLAEMTLTAHLPGNVDEIGISGLREDGVLNLETGMNRRVDAGYDRLTGFIANAVETNKGDITLNFTIDAIEWGPEGVTVRADDGREMSAKSAISTLPVGVLQSGAIRFTPDLPVSKKLALEKLKMGPVVKVLLRFKERFWPRWAANICCGVGPVTLYWPTSYKRNYDLPVLTAYATGPRAVALGSVSEDEAAEIITADLKRLFPASDPKKLLVDTRRVDWASDPYACGGYTFLKQGGTGARALLAAADTPALFWAGSATTWSPIAATVEAAYNSGLRAVEEVERFLS